MSSKVECHVRHGKKWKIRRPDQKKNNSPWLHFAYSDRPIASNITPIKALGRTYHPGHIKCYHCYCPLTEKTGAKERQQRVYCRKDYKELFLPKCRACNLPVEKEAVSAVDGKLQGKWHLNCFGCHVSVLISFLVTFIHLPPFLLCRRVINLSQITPFTSLKTSPIVAAITTN